ncbi:MAG: hypothetical protein H0U53_07910 [Actinobacteria bacterium]|nr:hypothetical protein [Actinomycetota bacterium]
MDQQPSLRAGDSQLRRYLGVLRRRWLIAVTALVASTAATLVYVLPQPNIYESGGTFVVVPRAVDAEANLEAFDTLIRGNAINSTYASIAGSDLIRARAEDALDQDVGSDEATVTTEVQTGTNLLSISVQSRDPALAQALAAAVGEQTVAYIAALNEAYRLQPLDFPEAPRSPVGPKRALTAAVGIVFGILLGLGLAATVDWVASQLGRPSEVRNRRPRERKRKTIREQKLFVDEASKDGLAIDSGRVSSNGSGREPPPAPRTASSPGFRDRSIGYP